MTSELAEALNDCLKKNPEFSRLFMARTPVSDRFANETKITCRVEDNGECFVTTLGLINTVLEMAGHKKIVAYLDLGIGGEEEIIEFSVQELPVLNASESALEDLRAQVDKRMMDPNYKIVPNLPVTWDKVDEK